VILIVEYWIDDNLHTTNVLNEKGEYTFKLPRSKGINLYYRFIAEDEAGNEASSETYSRIITEKEGGKLWLSILVVIIVLVVIITFGVFLIMLKKSKTPESTNDVPPIIKLTEESSVSIQEETVSVTKENIQKESSTGVNLFDDNIS